MEATQGSLLRFMEGADKRFIIPVYQRNYDWKKEQCETLLEDLIAVFRNQLATHFFGSIVFVGDDNSSGPEYSIIDGQQRLTTISLLLLAIYNCISDKNIESSILNAKKIRDSYLIDEYSTDEVKLKLKLIKNDRVAYESLFLDEDRVSDSKINGNYNYFYKRISNMEINEIEGVLLAIQKLVVVKISIKPNHGDNPQLIFESLNSTGLDLEEADKIRNFILMDLTVEDQEIYYTKYWAKIENETLHNVSAFIRFYLAIKEQKLYSPSLLYKNFKQFVLIKKFDDKSILLRDLLKYAQYYNRILCAEGNEGYNGSITRIKMMDLSMVYPFLMELFDAQANNLVTYDELAEILRILETYIIRRVICGISFESLNKTFAFMGNTIKNLVEDEKISYIVAFKYVILNYTGHYRFPRDFEFEEKFIQRDIYSISPRYKKYIFAEIENYDNRERLDIYSQLDNGDLSIEHIMPQTLKEEWKEELGANWEIIHEKYVHTIGNLTLTAYNSKYSNLPFRQKRDMEKGFKESRLLLNKFVSQQEKWTEKEIKQRADFLLNRALCLWKLPECSFIKENEEDWYGLDEENIDYTGKQISQYRFLNDVTPATDWTAMFKNIANTLYRLDATPFESIVNKEFPENRVLEKRFSKTADNLRNPHEVAEGIYIETNLNTQAKIDMLRVLLLQYNVDLQDLTFKLKTNE